MAFESRHLRTFAASLLVLISFLSSTGRLEAEASPSLAERLAGREVAIMHPALDDPPIRSAAAADHMRPDDVVAGLSVDGVSRAYPWWILKNHHTVNDRVAEVDLVVAFCEQCSAATAFRRELGERLLLFETEGVSKGTIILRDRETGTLWSPFEGRGLEGPLAGEALERIPTFLTTWREWQRRHPDTEVVYADKHLRSGHGEREHPGKWGIVGEMGETIGHWDTRLAENEFVHGVVESGEARAYPVREIQAAGYALQDRLGDRAIVIFSNGDYEMAGYDRRLGSRLLSFEAEGSEAAVFADLETGSLWSIEGVAVRGELSGERLTALDSYSSEWHIWSEYHPETSIYGELGDRDAADFAFPLRSLLRLDGEKLRSEPLSFDASLNLVLVWARWCAPCHEKLPIWSRLAGDAEAKGYGFNSIALQVDVGEEISALKAFLFSNEIEWPIYLFDDLSYEKLDAAYRSASGRGLSIPMIFVVDGGGRVIRIFEGSGTDRIESWLAEELARVTSPGSGS